MLAYRYGFGLLLAVGLVLTSSYVAAALTASLGYQWLNFGNRPEHLSLIGLAVFVVPLVINHRRRSDFPALYRVIGALIFFISLLSLAEWGAWSYLPFSVKTVERLYELFGLCASAGAIWLGIARKWDGIVNCGSIFFAIFLFCRLYHWWWDWMPRYLFFAVIGAIAIALVVAFKRLRAAPARATGVQELLSGGPSS